MAGLPSQVLEERLVHLQNAQDASGDPKNVLRGKAPNAQASGNLLNRGSSRRRT